MERLSSGNVSIERLERARQSMIDFLTSPSHDESAFSSFCRRYVELLEACSHDEDWVSTVINECIDRELSSPTKEQIEFWKSQFTREELEVPSVLPQSHREIIEWMESARKSRLYEPEAEVWEWLTKIVAKKQRLSRDEAALLIEDHAENLAIYRGEDA